MSQLGQVIASHDITIAIPDSEVVGVRPGAKQSTVTASDKKPTLTTAEDYWRAAWERIQEIAPKAILLRCPSHLGLKRAQAWDGSTDMDILLEPADFAPAMAVLKNLGFYHVFKGQSFIERFQVRVAGHPMPCMVDLYRTERWGRGFRLAKHAKVPADPRIACLMRCVVDTKGTAKFEKRQGGPPWQWKDGGMPEFGPLGRALWRTGNRKLLTLYLLLKGTIRPEAKLILRGIYRSAVYRIWRLTRKQGLEIELMGVDGAGKSSVADTLRQLPAPVKVIYMGPHDYRTRIMRFCARHSLPRPFPQLALRYDSLLNRLSGWFSAYRGWIVIYDRMHPFERIDPMNRTLSGRVRNVIDRI
jgi:hypothetical protein